MSYQDCREVSLLCPVEATTYGYYPNLAGNAFLLTFFAVLAIAQGTLAFRYRVWPYSIVVGINCAVEAIGYGGRIMMNDNPWNYAGFQMQVVCLILAPSFLAAGIYLTLKHIIIAFGPEKSRLKPYLYTWIFITCDAISIVLQAIGGGMAASGDAGSSILETGNNIMIGGIAFQVATMAVCVLLALDFTFRMFKSRRQSGLTDAEKAEQGRPQSSKGLYFFLGCITLAFMAVFVRCIYRLPEMAGGWGNHLMRIEHEFLILDGAMIALASLLMTIAHPGKYFPEMQSKKLGKRAAPSPEFNDESSDRKSDHSSPAMV